MTDDELGALLGAEDLERRRELGQGQRLVHYTSAEAAWQIISGQEMWLRNATAMNDFSEIDHGIGCLIKAWHSPAGEHLRAMLDRFQAGLSQECAALFDQHALIVRNHTFITSLSEHDDDEDDYGRLSMWRAYGGRNGVALVLNTTAFTGDTAQMSAFSSPIHYQDANGFAAWFDRWVARLLAAEDRLAGVAPNGLGQAIVFMFRIFALCTKHPGFREEREWRVFTSPHFEAASDWVRYEIATIRGVPQQIAKLKLIDDEERGIVGVAPKSLINRIIIGPCEHPNQIAAAMYEALRMNGVERPWDMIRISDIPLRQSPG